MIAPLLYANYPFGGAVRYSREVGQSIIPYWAIIRDSWYNYGTTSRFPWIHSLARIYYSDFRAAEKQVAANSVARDKFLHLFIAGFPIMPLRGGEYRLNFAYTLPNGTVTNSSIQKTLVVP